MMEANLLSNQISGRLEGTLNTLPNIDEDSFSRYETHLDSDRKRLADLGIRVEIASPNFIYVQSDITHVGEIELVMPHTGSTIVFCGREGYASISGKWILLGSKNLAYFGTLRHLESRLELVMIGDRQLLYWGDGATTNGTSLNLVGHDRKIVVGDDCMFAVDTWIRNSDQHAIFDFPSAKKINKDVDIVLEPHVWVGHGAGLLKPERIGFGTIVGASSLVTSSLPPLAIAAGMPAKVRRREVSWDRSGEFRAQTKAQLDKLVAETNYRPAPERRGFLSGLFGSRIRSVK